MNYYDWVAVIAVCAILPVLAFFAAGVFGAIRERRRWQ